MDASTSLMVYRFSMDQYRPGKVIIDLSELNISLPLQLISVKSCSLHEIRNLHSCSLLVLFVICTWVLLCVPKSGVLHQALLCEMWGSTARPDRSCVIDMIGSFITTHYSFIHCKTQNFAQVLLNGT
jgi:hypothetical protein